MSNGTCPDCQAVFPVDLTAKPLAAVTCPSCGQEWRSHQVRTPASYADSHILYGARGPRDAGRGVITIWSRPLRRRLEESTLSAGLAAKRDLERYHELLADQLPTVKPSFAVYLVDLLSRTDDLGGVPPPDTLNRVERLALLDAADRCISAHRKEGGNLLDLLPRFFRLHPED